MDGQNKCILGKMEKEKDKVAGQGSPESNDFVIRDGFPALRLANGDHWIDGDEPIPKQNFWACEDALSLDEPTLDLMRSDCETVFTARTKGEGEPYSLGVTYFCPCQMKPRCALEALVLDLFRQHTKDLPDGSFVPEQSGAEWWTLVLDDDNEIANSDQDDGSDEEDEGDEVGMHFDADYGLEDQAPNLLLHPRLATVTYLSDCGAPTLILDQRSPPPNDTEKNALKGDIRKGWLSQPRIGKHIAFDGRLLHGAPATFFPDKTSQKTNKKDEQKGPPPKKAKLSAEKPARDKRYTLLINVWLNHCPLDAEPLEEECIEKLKAPLTSADSSDVYEYTMKTFSEENAAEFAKMSLSQSKEDPAGEEEIVICNRVVTVKYGATMKDLHEAARKASLVELDLEPGALSLQVGEVVAS